MNVIVNCTSWNVEEFHTSEFLTPEPDVPWRVLRDSKRPHALLCMQSCMQCLMIRWEIYLEETNIAQRKEINTCCHASATHIEDRSTQRDIGAHERKSQRNVEQHN